MSLLNDLLSTVTGAGSGPAGDAQAHPSVVQALVGMLANGQLANAFSSGGLGHLLQSWIGTGQNMPISAEQVGAVLGSERVASLAHSAGVQPSDLLSQLSTLLPQLVDRATPNGALPSFK